MVVVTVAVAVVVVSSGGSCYCGDHCGGEVGGRESGDEISDLRNHGGTFCSRYGEGSRIHREWCVL